MIITADVTGHKQLEQRLTQARGNIDHLLRDILEQLAQTFPHNKQANITTQFDPSKSSIQLTFISRELLEQEFGTLTAPPRPWIMQALDDTRTKIRTRLKTALPQILAK